MKELNIYIVPALFLIGSFGVGIVAEKLILKKLEKYARRTKWKGDDILVHALRGIVLTWSLIAGVYFALHHSVWLADVMHIGNKIIFSLTVLSFAVLISRILIGLVHAKSGATQVSHSSSIISNLIRISIYIICFLIILQMLGISITPLLTALGVGALAVALALQDTLSNLFSGVQVVASHLVRLGDYIKLNTGEEGYVADITWRNTVIRALPNNYIVIPNSKIASAIVTNYFLPEKELAVLVEVGVAYDSDLKKVEAVTIAAGKEVLETIQGGVGTFDPFIRFHTFDDSSINFTVILRGKEFGDQFLIKHEFIKKLQERYRENNIEIPFPIRTVHLKETS